MEENGKDNGKEAEIGPEKFAALAEIAAQLCDVVLMCAPAFAPNSRGAQIVAMAADVQPRLAEMLASMAKEKGKEQEK